MPATFDICARRLLAPGWEGAREKTSARAWRAPVTLQSREAMGPEHHHHHPPGRHDHDPDAAEGRRNLANFSRESWSLTASRSATS